MIGTTNMLLGQQKMKLQYENCIKYNTNPAIAINATAGNLKRTQRAVAGLLYRFLIDTGREF